MTQPPPPTTPRIPDRPVFARPDRSAWRTAAIVVGAIVWVLGFGMLGMPVFIWLFGAPIDVGLAFVIALIADLLLAGVFVAGILLSRRGTTGVRRWLPPLIALAVLIAGFAVATQVVSTFAAR